MSDRRLVEKLGFKPGHRILTLNAPSDYSEMISPSPDRAVVSDSLTGQIDACHVFTDLRSELEHLLPYLMQRIEQDGMIWVSWPKKASGLPSEIYGNEIREVALPLGLVDVKVCSVSDVWSGMKLMIRKELRGR